MQRTSYGPGSLSRGSSVRKVLLERRDFASETQSLSNRQAIADGEPAKFLASSRLKVPN